MNEQLGMFGDDKPTPPPLAARRRKLTETDRWLADGLQLRSDGWPVDGAVELDGVDAYCRVCRTYFCPHAKPELYAKQAPRPVRSEYLEVEEAWCAKCNGVGQVDGKQCRTCLGRGHVLRRQGEDRAVSAPSAHAWTEEANRWFSRLPHGHTFDALDLGEAVPFDPANANENNRVGGWFGTKARSKRIVKTGRHRKSSRASRHVGVIWEWRKVR